MGYGGRLCLSLLCLLSPLYVVVFTACPQKLFTDPDGTISSPGFNTSQSYDDNLACTYRITVRTNRRVVLEIIKLSILGTMPDCQGDSLEILVGCSNTSIGKFCSCSNLSMPNKIYSVDNCMTLIFKSDESRRAEGFKAKYTSIDNNTKLDPGSNCSGIELLRSTEGTFYTPNWPLTYPPSTTCSWTFYPPEGKTVLLFFMSFEMEGKFECEANRPSVTGDEIRVNGTNSAGGKEDIIPRICAKQDKSYYTIKQMQAVTIRFASNRDDENSGVIAGYASYKKGTLESSSPGCQAIPEVPEPSTSTSTLGTKAYTVKTGSGEETKAKPVVVIVVVVVVVVVAVVVVGVAVYFFKRKPRRNEDAVLHPLKQQAIEITS